MFFLAYKQLISKKKQNILILLGISLGTLLYVCIAGIQLGLRGYMSEGLMNNTAHIIIKGREQIIDRTLITERMFGNDIFVKWIIPPSGKRNDSTLTSYQSWVNILNAHPDVYSFSPRLTINGIMSKNTISRSTNIVGTIPAKQIKISSIEEYMKVGSFSDLQSGGNKIILGIGLAKDLGVSVGQYVNIQTNKSTDRPFKVVGLLQVGNDQVDKVLSFAHINDVQTLNLSPGKIGEIAVSLTDMDKATEVADQWGMYTNDKVEDWQEANKMFMEMIKMQDVVRAFITISILIVAAFGIYNVLSIMINQKKKEIAILRSIGYRPIQVMELVLIQGLVLGIGGGLLGMFLGLLLNLYIETIDLGFELGKSNHLIISYDKEIFITAFLSALFASVIASFFPARMASTMTPIDIIRDQS